MRSHWIVCTAIGLLLACEDETESSSVASNSVSASSQSATTGSGGAGGAVGSGGSPGAGGGSGMSDIGGPCAGDNDCMLGQQCITQFPGGYCTIRNCDPDNPDSCPMGTVCLGGGGIGSFGCFVECMTSAECREAEGYACCGPSVCSAPNFGFCN